MLALTPLALSLPSFLHPAFSSCQTSNQKVLGERGISYNLLILLNKSVVFEILFVKISANIVVAIKKEES
jgi:hypothetical protein